MKLMKVNLKIILIKVGPGLILGFLVLNISPKSSLKELTFTVVYVTIYM